MTDYYSRPSSHTSIMSRICLLASVPSAAQAARKSSQRSSSQRKFRSVVPRGMSDLHGEEAATVAQRPAVSVGLGGELDALHDAEAVEMVGARELAVVDGSHCEALNAALHLEGDGLADCDVLEHGVLRGLVCRYTLNQIVGTRQVVRPNWPSEVAA